MARQSITAPPTGTNPSPSYSDNFWLKAIWVALTNAGATPAGSLGGNTVVIGNVASGVADSGAPVKMGLVYNSTPPSPTTGQRVDAQANSRGSMRVGGGDPLGVSAGYALTIGGNDINGQTRIIDLGSAGDAINYPIASMQYNFVGNSIVRVRTPNIVKTATATASGDTAVWTPTSSKKFRLMRYRIEVTSDAATSGGADIDVTLRDSTTGLNTTTTVFVPAVAGTVFGGGATSGWVDIGNGLLSAAANNVLNVNLSAALTSGKVRVIVCGTEE